MTDNEIFYRLFSGGNFTLPYLVKLRLSQSDVTPLCFINSNVGVSYENEEYTPCSLEYTPPDNEHNGGSLSITGIKNNLIDWAEEADDHCIIDVVGALIDGEIVPLHTYRHFFGSISYSENMVMEFTLGNDDRMDMQFCPYKFDTDNNRSNA